MKYFIKKITDNIEKKGGKIILNAEINSIKHHEKEKEISFIKNDDKNKIKPDIIVYSTPPSITLQWFEKIPIEIEIEAKKNRMFNSIMVFLVIDVPKLFDDWIITVYDTNLIIFRISQQSILSNEIVDKNKTLLCIEIRTIDGDNISKMSEVEIYQKIESDLTKMSILKNERIIKRKLIKIKHVYPIKSAENQNLDKIFDFITSFKNEYMINTIVDTGKLAATRREDENSNVDPDATGIYKAILNAEALTKKIILE
jgi:protoporphyrinogen oxidase